MKTKHLFLATALVASFASCTNEEIVEMQQGVVERPTVDNVRLNFVADGVDSRLVFGSTGYAWEADDVIGALNMDQPNATVNTPETWSTKYDLTNFINTSYPFTYDAESGTWGTPGKMLEGNYFFAFPFTDYEGERYAKYSLIDQQQTGIKGAVVAKNYADNQVFVGYSPILKGTGFDILSDIEMTSLLGAVQLRIVNEGTKAYHINKIVINGTKVKSGFQLDPKTAAYTNYSTGLFNTANYLGKDFDGDKVAEDVLADIEDETFATERMEALRAVADFNGAKNFVQLFVNGTEEERALAVDGTAYALVMVNPIQFFTIDEEGDFTTTPKADCGTLTATIYTDEGIIENVNLLNTSDESLVTSGYVKSTKPGVANTVVINITDKMVKEATSLSVYTEEDLLQLISWNAGVAKKTTATATLKADIELTKEAIDLLKTNEKLTLKIRNEQNATKSLTLAADLAADVLSYEGLKVLTAQETVTEDTETVKYDAVPVKVAGEINLVKESIKLASIEVLEDAVLNINVLNANVPATVTVAEGGTLNIGAAAKTSNTVTITNNGTMTVAAGALVQGAINNNGELNLNGTANNVVNTKIVNLGATSKLLGGANGGKDAIIYTVSGATLSNIADITGAVKGEVKYVDGAVIVYKDNASTVASKVFVEVANATVVDAAKYTNKGVNLWKFMGNVEVTHCVTLSEVQIEEGAVVELTVKSDSTLTIPNLTVLEGGAISVNGMMKVTNLVVKEDAELTNNGTITVETSINNAGLIYNNGTIQSKAATTLLPSALVGVVVKDNAESAKYATYWKHNAFQNYDDTLDTLKKEAMTKAVKVWMNKFKTFSSVAKFYAYNPYDYTAFLNAVNESTNDDFDGVYEYLLTKVYGEIDSEENEETDDVSLFTADELNPAKTKTNTIFTTVVGELLTSDMQTTIKNYWIDTTTGSTTLGQFNNVIGLSTILGKGKTYISDDAAGVNKLVAKMLTKNYASTVDNTIAGAKTAAAIWDELTAIGTALSTTGVLTANDVPTYKYYFITKEDNIYKAVVAWATHSVRIEDDGFAVEASGTAKAGKFDVTASTTKNTVANLQNYIKYLTNLSTMTKAQQSAYDAIDEYIEYILALDDATTFEPAQLNACWAHSKDAKAHNESVALW